jgi:hypothetical protein
LADLAEAPDTAALDAALPSGGTNTGTISADRIIKIAKPTRKSTIVTCHVRFEFFITAFLSLSPLLRAIQFPDSRKVSPFKKLHNPLRINMLGVSQKQPTCRKAID